ncbi:MAG: hypothetical protein IPL42_17470 [Saprospiraceae bacterium]|nr:hypothetical protein [Saprospiraceae bacterium]
MADRYFAQSDLVYFKTNNLIDIYEIKSSSSNQGSEFEDADQAPSKEEHLNDLCFQYLVAVLAGYQVDRLFLAELNKTYTKQGEIDLTKLFNISDVTRDIISMSDGIKQKMVLASSKSKENVQPVTCECKYKARKNQCPALPYLHPEMVGYTVHDLSRIGIGKKRLAEFIDNDITDRRYTS